MTSLIHNERTNLLATAVNNVGVAFIVVGCVTPAVGCSYGLPNFPPMTMVLGAFTCAWLLTGAGLLYVARRTLVSLRP